MLGPGGTEEQRGDPKPVAGDPLSLSVPVRPLGRGVYTVSWKIVSAVDGHATDGTYAFGVRASPRGVAATSGTSTPSSSGLELLARLLFIVGVVALLGGTVASLARFGGAGRTDLALAAAGWVASIVGLVLLAEAQRRAAGSSLGDLLDTDVGRALLQRGVALAIAAAGLLAAWRVPRVRRAAMGFAALATLAAIVAHVAAGHAAAGGWPAFLTVAAQSAHFAAAGIWFGGLAALLLGIRGAPSAARATAVRRFAAAALAALLVVVATGTLRAVDELSGWGDLFGSGYGRAILAKVVLVGLVIAIAVRYRRRVESAPRDLGSLRRTSAPELALALAALFLAALLGTMAPPVSGQPANPGVLAVTGADFGTSVRVELTTASDQPGPNLFTVRAEDYDSGDAALVDGVDLLFTPLDDPDVESSSLPLSRVGDGEFAGTGSNLAFDGRWGVAVTVRRGRETVQVPLELDLPGPEHFVSVLRIPGRIPKYTMQIGYLGNLRIEPKPERVGPSRIYVTCFTSFGSMSDVERMVVTTAQGERMRQLPLRRLDTGRFVADAVLTAGANEIGVVARTRDGTRLRGVFEIEVPGR